MPSLVPAIPQEVDIAANALRRIAVMARAVYLAGRLDVETLGVDR